MNYNALSLFSSAGVAETYFDKHGIHVKVAAELLPQRAEILIDFRAFYGLDKYNLKQIDQYVWLLGKDYFPKNYGKKRRGEK